MGQDLRNFDHRYFGEKANYARESGIGVPLEGIPPTPRKQGNQWREREFLLTSKRKVRYIVATFTT